MIRKQRAELNFSTYISEAAKHQHLAFSLRSDRAITRHARLAAFWYQMAIEERQLMLIGRYNPNLPLYQQGLGALS
jgi:hypothetical protein